MNTKQKLTLGIAAIFMVTLTIVGVTYAYFVTRVNGATTETVNIKTASLATAKYVDGTGLATLSNVLPGEVVYKGFSVTNTSQEDDAEPAAYTIYVTSREYSDEETPTDGSPKFIHTDKTGDTLTNACYKAASMASNTATPSECFDGNTYNNIKYTVYEVSSLPTVDTIKTWDENTDTATLEAAGIKDANVVAENQKDVNLLHSTNLNDARQDVKSDTVVKGTDKYYILKIEYVNADANQNIENLAKLDVLVSIR